MMRLVKQLKEKRKAARRHVLVPEFSDTDEPTQVYFYPPTPAMMSAARKMLDEYQLEVNNFTLTNSMLAVMMLDEKDERLVGDGELMDFMANVEYEVADRISQEMQGFLDETKELDAAKKP